MKRTCHHAITVAMLCCLAGSSRADRDDVQFGDAAAEKAHGFVGEQTQVHTGGLGESCRSIDPQGSLAFDLRCDPVKPNYLTVKLWGSDVQVCALFLAGEARHYGRYGEALPELDLCQGGPACPGRFYYATYPVPRELTAGKKRVRLKLMAIGAINAYAPKDQVEQPLKGPSRGIYRAYLDTDSYFVPGRDEKQGTAPAVRARTPVPAEFSRANRHGIDEAVTRLLAWQLYGPAWQARVTKHEAPAMLTGAFIRGGPPRTPPADWLDWVTERTTDANCDLLKTAGVYAGAYQLRGSKYYRDPELLDRVVKALDFYCVAQGRNGGLSAHRWVGGPRRADAGGFIEGDGARWLGRAFLLLHPMLKDAGVLNEMIDDDNDPATAALPRRSAYARLFAWHRDFLVSPAGRGHAANQDLFQSLALWLDNEALRLLDPGQAWPRDQALAYVHQAAGLKHDPLGGYWLSAQGLPLEPWGTLGGGYCGNYGLLCTHLLCELAEVTGDPLVRRQALRAVRASSHFYYPDTDDRGLPCFRKEGVISTRNTKWPAVLDYGVDEYAAAELKSPEALRAFQLWLADGHRPEPPDPKGHFVNDTVHRAFTAVYFDQLLGLPKTDARLFMEPGQPDGAWADAQGQVVAVRDRGVRLYVSLNWRRGFRQNQRDAGHAWANNVARAHAMTPAFDRIATFAMENVGGFGGLNLCRYGDYWIAMNASTATTYPVQAPPDLGPAVRDLVSGREWPVGAVPDVKPGETLVLKAVGAGPE